ncbi:GerMN domain-containing protein [Lachnoclostridium sp. Marseille-P6806]|uniref:GerMN domain-containing protein n=1 Tax=Lachnoclostridium sp. Marseille-P6806 TaxID=2364793 RepID=UPI001031F25F|nr:GerMN domain-containing protein [Lachnoclostridium sp. Marseille-P6806]
MMRDRIRGMLNFIQSRKPSAAALGICVLGFALMLFVLLSAMRGDPEPGERALSSSVVTDASNGASVKIYYLSKNITSIVPVSYVPEDTSTEGMIDELLAQLSREQDQIEYVSPISGFSLLGRTLLNGNLTLDFTAEYHGLDVIREILSRAAIVDTLAQVNGVRTVTFEVEGLPLADDRGELIGPMSAEHFVFNLGKDINSYEKARLHLYFADKEGDSLVNVNRTVIYNSNISMDKLIVEEILKGPNGSGIYPTVNPETTLISVTSRDGVCYINFDKAFLSNPNAVTAEVSIYSIVNSITELAGISRVHISVEGDAAYSYMDTLSLKTAFERDLSMVEDAED